MQSGIYLKSFLQKPALLNAIQWRVSSNGLCFNIARVSLIGQGMKVAK